MGTLHEDICTFMIIFCSIHVKMRNFKKKIGRENQNTHFIFKSFSPKIMQFMRQCGKIW